MKSDLFEGRDFFESYFLAVHSVSYDLTDLREKFKATVDTLAGVRINQGRVFVIGMGGSAGNASHMVNDLRKLCDIEAYCPTDNVPELTARANDNGLESVFDEYLRTSRLSSRDAVFVLSVGGGSIENNISVSIVLAVKYAKKVGAAVLGIVGRADGYVAQNCESVMVVPIREKNRQFITPLSEAFQAIIWHGIVSNPALQTRPTTW
jgi:D-sedoheptulose 7-phosphate isomerase